MNIDYEYIEKCESAAEMALYVIPILQQYEDLIESLWKMLQEEKDLYMNCWLLLDMEQELKAYIK